MSERVSERTTGWTADDIEEVVCCLCRQPGEPVYSLDPFRVVRCPGCSLVFLSPRLHAEGRQRFYDDVGYFERGVYGGGRSFSPAMLWQRLWASGRLNLITAELARWGGPAPQHARLLEVGAAYGLFLDAARDRGFDVTGVELSEPAAKSARRELGLDVRHGELEAINVEGGYDVICAWDTLEHVPDPVAFVRRVADLLGDGGVVAFSTPYFSSLPARLFKRRWWNLKPAEHIWHFTPETHRLVFAEAGLTISRFIRNPLALPNLTRTDSLVGLARRAR